jgi:large subunit ribosomal protein L10
MKTRAQKEAELANARELFNKSEALIFADFTKITAENLRKLRTELKKSGANFLVIKKRILGILLKEKGIDVDLKQFKTSVGTIFSEVDSEHIAGPAFKFFSGMEVPEGEAKDVWIKKILAGYNITGGTAMTAEDIVYIGKLPPREVVLAQLLGMLAAPIRSFLYVLDEKSKMGGGGAAAQPVAESPTPAAPAAPEPVAEPAVESAEPAASSPDTESPEQKVELTQAQ